MSAAIKSVCQVGLMTANPADLIAFYRDLMGLPVLFEANGMTFMRAGATSLMIAAAATPPARGEDVTLYFEPEDWTETESRLIQAGVAFERDTMVVQRHGGREHVLRPFRDPEGRRLYLLGWRSESPT